MAEVFAKVARSFIKQYYDVLARTPENLHKFYAPTATYSYGTGSEGASISTGAEIAAQLSNIEFKGVQVDLSAGSVDITPTEDGSLISVHGVMTFASSATSSNFTQTFLLGQINGAYFLMNDMLRLSTVVPTKEVKEVVATEPVTQASVEVSAVDQRQVDEAEAVLDEIEMGHMPEELPQEDAQPEVAAEEEVPAQAVSPVKQPAVEAQPVAPKEPEKPAAPKSWASIAAKSSPAPAPVATSNGPRVVKAAAAKPANSASKKEGGRVSADIDLSKSLFVKDVTPEVTKANLENVLQKFGKVTSVEINSERRYAFVTFEESTSVQKAAKDGKIECAGATLSCEERHAAPKNRNNRGTRGGRSRSNVQNSNNANSNGRPRPRNRDRGAKTNAQRP